MEQNNIDEILSIFFPNNEKEIVKKLFKWLSEGSVAVDIKEFDDKEKEIIKKFENENHYIVLLKDKVYFQKYLKYEEEIIKKIKEIKENENTFKEDELKKIKEQFKKHFFSNNNTIKNEIDWQLVAVALGLKKKFFIITGGPGTGKTTTILRLLTIKLLLNPDLKIAIAAPTGKAASRVNESLNNNIKKLDIPNKEKILNIKAQTIHRLLEARNDGNFYYNKNNKMPYDLIIVDESSMIDISLMHKLLISIKKDASIVLLGDKDQLASVEAGSVFGDLCKSVIDENKNKNILTENDVKYLKEIMGDYDFSNYIAQRSNILTGSVIQLEKNYRFSKDSDIGQLALNVIEGNTNQEFLNKVFNNEFQKVKFFETKEKEKDYLKKLYKEFIPNDKNDTLNTIQKIKILCAVKNDPKGYDVNHFNLEVEKIIKKDKADKKFYQYKQLILTSNDYENNVFNGDIGIIDIINGKPKVIFPAEDGNKKIIDPYRLTNVQTAFAITIHKSQGSEFDKVIIVLPSSINSKILNRELLYTAITRAKNEIVIIGSKDVFKKAIEQTAFRSSGITERIKEN